MLLEARQFPDQALQLAADQVLLDAGGQELAAGLQQPVEAFGAEPHALERSRALRGPDSSLGGADAKGRGDSAGRAPKIDRVRPRPAAATRGTRRATKPPRSSSIAIDRHLNDAQGILVHGEIATAQAGKQALQPMC